jgi:hypothetical protein
MSEEEVRDEAVDEEDEQLQEALAVAIRAPQRGDLEQILASNLAAALFAPPLDKIRQILECYFLLPPEERENVASEWEREYIGLAYEVAVSLSSTIEHEPPTPYHRGRYASVPWSFSINEADRYLEPFISRIWEWEFREGDGWWEFFDRVKKADLQTEEGREVWRAYLRELARFLGCGWSPLALVEQVKTEFTVRVMPYASTLLREIFRRYISRETWEQMLSIFGGRSKAKAATQP